MSIAGRCLFLEYAKGNTHTHTHTHKHTPLFSSASGGTRGQPIKQWTPALFKLKCVYPSSSHPHLLMNHCLTYKSLACLHRLCVMTTSGMAGWGLRKCWESVCVRESACVNKSQIRYQQGSWSVSAAGKTPNRRLPNTSEPGLLGGWQEGPQKKASRRSSNACARVCVCEWVCLRREVVVGKCVRKLVLLTWRGLWFRRHYGSHCFFFFFC